MIHPENATGLEGLAERCERAEGPDRRLDAEIACALRFPNLRPAEPDDFAGEYGYSPGNIKVPTGFLMSSSYTGSVDAVRTLIDSADEWELTTLYGVARAAVGLNRDQKTHWTGYGEHLGGDPVLALLAAALRARQQEAKDHV